MSTRDANSDHRRREIDRLRNKVIFLTSEWVVQAFMLLPLANNRQMRYVFEGVSGMCRESYPLAIFTCS